MQEIGHWINGKRVAGTSGRFADVMNPATGAGSTCHAGGT
jgi:malonate-semialdehyde dehydrogenase (acetylating) / methylmalonate-semialdehyde dehydrogenase